MTMKVVLLSGTVVADGGVTVFFSTTELDSFEELADELAGSELLPLMFTSTLAGAGPGAVVVLVS